MTDTSVAVSEPVSTPPVKHSRARRVLALVLIVLILLLGLAIYLLYNTLHVSRPTSGGKPIDTGGVEWVRSIYGTSQRPQDLFQRPQAAVPGANGIIWVTDIGKPSVVMQFTADGRYVGFLKSAKLADPINAQARIAIGPDKKIYICETSLDRVHVLLPNGEDGGTFSVPKPVSIAVSKDRIVVGSVSGFAVLDKTGKPIGVFGSRGKGPEQFDYVHGVAIGPDDSIYVSDSYNNRLSAYEPNGKLRWRIRTGAPANSAQLTNDMLTPKAPEDVALKGLDALQLPLGLTIDGAGRVVVIDMYDGCLAAFNAKTGKFIAKYGEYGAEDGQFFYPVSVSYDRGRDWFAVADAFNRRIQIVRIPGSSSTAGGAMGAIKRALAGPLRACAFPLLLLLIALAIYLVARYRQRQRMEDAERALDAG